MAGNFTAPGLDYWGNAHRWVPDLNRKDLLMSRNLLRLIVTPVKTDEWEVTEAGSKITWSVDNIDDGLFQT